MTIYPIEPSCDGFVTYDDAARAARESERDWDDVRSARAVIVAFVVAGVVSTVACALTFVAHS